MKNLSRASLLRRAALLLIMPVSLLANPVHATFVGVNGAQAFGYYVGPYYGSLEGVSVDLYSMDFANEDSFGHQWMVDLSHIDTQEDLANTRFGSRDNALQLYQEAAWLTLQYSLNPASSYGDIQATIWQLFDSSAPSPSSGYWLSEAQANYASGNYHNFFVVTKVGHVHPTGHVQELLTALDPAMPVYPAAFGMGSDSSGAPAIPEPHLFLPVALALAGLAAYFRWRHRRAP